MNAAFSSWMVSHCVLATACSSPRAIRFRTAVTCYPSGKKLPSRVVSEPLLHAPRMPLGDEAKLQWYFGVGMAAFERSPMGAMIDRLDLLANHRERRCKKCENGALPNGRDCPACKGTGFLARFQAAAPPLRTGYCRCPTCKGRGEHAGKVCSQCDGDRYISEDVNAYANPDHAEASGYLPDDTSLQRFAWVSRRLALLPGMLHAEVLEAFYGDAGARWGLTRHGRILALYPLTRKGSAWSAAARKESEKHRKSSDLSPSEILGVQAELEKSQPKRERRAALDTCERQAKVLYVQAVRAWLDVGEPEGWLARWRGLQERIEKRRAVAVAAE